MKTRKIGSLTVSDVCLGTMTYGNATLREDAFAQMDRALDAGIGFWDTAEMYPVNPATAETYGLSEIIIGEWFARSGRRADVQIATKASGKGGSGRFSRGDAGFEPGNIEEAVDLSLKRLQTDVIDLYQLHWPRRGTYAFRGNWTYDPGTSSKARVEDHMNGIAEAMGRVVASGKVREFGLSNETAWGTMAWNAAADRTGGPRVVSIQNEYGPLHRLYDTDMAEVGQKEDVTLLAYSPLAAGLATGKYSGGATPPGSRAAVDVAHGGPGNLGGRRTDRGVEAADGWVALARDLGHDPVHLAIAFVRARPFPAIPIIGATDTGQLDHLLAGLDVTIDADAAPRIDAFHRAHPLPF
ncbi:aldo/keto reductase [Paracoccus aeridis]|uniref:aldo/keto reductase n=1 Tax=Paracoccus aeridis TaxID=1966466 RepID=UPI001F2BC4C0|nr:aldo/keto reductase [Paracoccus aeridis]